MAKRKRAAPASTARKDLPPRLAATAKLLARRGGVTAPYVAEALGLSTPNVAAAYFTFLRARGVPVKVTKESGKLTRYSLG